MSMGRTMTLEEEAMAKYTKAVLVVRALPVQIPSFHLLKNLTEPFSGTRSKTVFLVAESRVQK